MHARELVDLAAFVAAQGSAMLGSVRQVPENALAQYWTASKCRLDRWNRALRSVQISSSSSREVAHTAARNFQAMSEEILVSEMLTRVWSSLLASLDYLAGGGDAQPVATNVLAAHVEASNRVLAFIADNPRDISGIGSELNRLRRVTERWTDLLLGRLGSLARIANFAHEVARAEEFARDFGDSQAPRPRRQAWNLLAASLHKSFAPYLQAPSPNADLNDHIAGAILACFPAEVFDSAGIAHSLWDLRVSLMTADAQQLVDQLLAADSAQPPTNF